MSKGTKSRTEKETFRKTTITDGKEKAVGRGNTAKEAEKRASDRWDKKKGK